MSDIIYEGERPVPPYAVHSETEIKGFFGEYSFLSNFWPTQVTYKELVYPSVENAYQALKVDKEQRPQFATCTPAQSKKLSRTLIAKGFGAYTSSEWDAIKLTIMKILVFHKFMRRCELAERLEATHPKYLEESNVWKDKFWGVYYCDGKCHGGDNYLGEILMAVRAILII